MDMSSVHLIRPPAYPSVSARCYPPPQRCSETLLRRCPVRAGLRLRVPHQREPLPVLLVHALLHDTARCCWDARHGQLSTRLGLFADADPARTRFCLPALATYRASSTPSTSSPRRQRRPWSRPDVTLRTRQQSSLNNGAHIDMASSSEASLSMCPNEDNAVHAAMTRHGLPEPILQAAFAVAVLFRACQCRPVLDRLNATALKPSSRYNLGAIAPASVTSCSTKK